ncbi:MULTISPECIES: AAA family ATPase [Paracoccus]|uniref:AAA family ATPase n=1 Tax=Paracoccus TaxID=265 RepID=UPI00086C08E0|nr:MULTISPECIES: AAA family ATPase [Paracoccus]ODT60975.1 MAG: hypothetical protein ABS73_03820 [Paracoccus sp. SCN 68-21]
MKFADLWARGYTSLVPIIPPTAPISANSTLFKRIGTPQDGRGKTPGIKGRDGNWFSWDWVPHVADETDLERWQRMGAGIGIKTGSGLIAIDADAPTEENARIIRDAIERHLGGALPIRVGRYPKALYLCRVTDPYSYTRIDFGPRDDRGQAERVEALSDGRMFVAHGIHPGTRQPYTWPRDLVDYDDLPLFEPNQIDGLLQELLTLLPQAGPDPKLIREGATTDINQAALRGDVQTVRRAVAATPNTSHHFPSRESYRDFGYAIKAALPDHEDEAFEIYASWCDRWEDDHGRTNDPDVYAADWRRMKGPFRVGASYLYEKADATSEGAFNRADAWFQPVARDEATGQQHGTTIFDTIAEQERENNPEAQTPPITAGRMTLDDLDDLPPREWLYGHKILRKYVTFIAAPGGVGKTAFTYAMALSCAANIALLHDKPQGGRPLRVWLYNLEDDIIELKRRLKAALQHYDLGPAALENLRLNSGRDRGMKIVRTGTGTDAGFIVQPDYHLLIEEMKREAIDVLIVDPFLRSHGVSENDNEAQDEVMRLFAQIAQETDAAVVLVHHTKKGAIAGDLDSMRGGSTQGGGARSAYTLAPMSSEEAVRVGVPDEERRMYVRIDDAKSNMAPPLAKTEWLKLEGVALGNGAGAYAGGDNVQVATPWQMPDAWDGVGDQEAPLLRLIGEGMEDGERYSARTQDKGRWVGDLVVATLGKSPEQAKVIIAAWLKEGRIETREYQSKTQRKTRKGLYVKSVAAEDVFG